MFYLFLAIIFPVLSVIIFKLFERFNIHVLTAVVSNYIVAALICLSLNQSDKSLSFTTILEDGWGHFAFIVGLFFMFNFYFIAQTTQKMGISVATLANKLSVVVPVIVAIILLKESTSVFKYIGILMTVCSIFLLTRAKERGRVDKRLLYLPIGIFIMTGLTDVIIAYSQQNLLKRTGDLEFFIGVTFIFSFVTGVIFLISKFIEVNVKSIFGGFVLGIPNGLGVYFLFKSLSSSLETSIVFPILSIGSLFLAVLIGFLFFKEKISIINWIGVLLAGVSILLLSL